MLQNKIAFIANQLTLIFNNIWHQKSTNKHLQIIFGIEKYSLFSLQINIYATVDILKSLHANISSGRISRKIQMVCISLHEIAHIWITTIFRGMLEFSSEKGSQQLTSKSFENYSEMCNDEGNSRLLLKCGLNERSWQFITCPSW